MPEATVIIRVDSELKSAFTEAAQAADRTTSQLVRDFMRDFVRQQAGQGDHDVWLRQKAEAGRAAARAGRVRSSEEVEAHVARRRAASSRRAGATGA